MKSTKKIKVWSIVSKVCNVFIGLYAILLMTSGLWDVSCPIEISAFNHGLLWALLLLSNYLSDRMINKLIKDNNEIYGTSVEIIDALNDDIDALTKENNRLNKKK